MCLSRHFQFSYNVMWQPYNPIGAVTPVVWAISFSIASTREIDVSFSSCRY